MEYDWQFDMLTPVSWQLAICRLGQQQHACSSFLDATTSTCTSPLDSECEWPATSKPRTLRSDQQDNFTTRQPSPATQIFRRILIRMSGCTGVHSPFCASAVWKLEDRTHMHSVYIGRASLSDVLREAIRTDTEAWNDLTPQPFQSQILPIWT